MMDDKHIDQSLEGFFAEERENAFEPSNALLAQIMADAQNRIDQSSPEPLPASAGFFRKIFDGIGGWPSLAGLATASIVGVWIGYVQPTAVEPFTDYLISSGAESYLYDVSPASGIFGMEG